MSLRVQGSALRRHWLTQGLIVLLVLVGGTTASDAAARARGRAASATPAAPAADPDLGPVLSVWEKAKFRFTPAVKTAYLKHVKEEVRRRTTEAGKKLPDAFYAWIDSDPLVQATVYGARRDPVGVVLMLRSLELDLGSDTVRKNYTQLALAAAVVFAKDGEKADLTPRKTIRLRIGGDPREPVNTRDPHRKLDVNDHIINFLNENTIEEEVVVGQREVPAELKYDSRGIAIPAPKGKTKKVPVKEKRTRTLYAADVLADRALQEKFNAYMKAKGQTVRVDCGDKVVHWNSHDMVHGEQHKKVADAFTLFRTAYEAKGLLPAKRDPIPAPAERCAYLIRNDRYVFPPAIQAQRKWPRYPLTAPWPTMTLLVANDQPLREREERWEAFRDRGELITYGEYIGSVAQQFDMQSARRVKPYPFTYGSVQMMLKDGGVCGTMANISVRSHCTLGVPSCTAGQPGHCALILFGVEPKTGEYRCYGGQYATGGDDKTHPHTPWCFGDVDANRPMVYYQSVAWAVNYGLADYYDSMLAYSFYQRLPEIARRDHGLKLLENCLAVNPYNFAAMDAGLDSAVTPGDAIRFWKAATAPLASLKKPGCPTNGLYEQTARQKLFAVIAKLPVPSDPKVVANIEAFMRAEKCEDAASLTKYKAATGGLSTLLDDTQKAFKAHLESTRTETSCDRMAATVNATAARIADSKKRREWAAECWRELQGRECYFGRGGRITLDVAVRSLARHADVKLRAESEQFQPLLDQLKDRLNAEITAGRTPKGSARLAKTIETVAKQIKTPEQKRRWLESLAQTIRGREEYSPKNAKPVRDPCADMIRNLLSSTT